MKALKNIIDKYSNSDFIDIENIIYNYWIEIDYIDFEKINWIIIWDRIWISKNISKEKQRFTIAHELWHAILFNNWINEINIEIEKKCDEFAWRLLVSENHLIEAWKYEKSKNKLAKKFWVSDVCLEIRLDKENITPSETFWLAPILHNR